MIRNLYKDSEIVNELTVLVYDLDHHLINGRGILPRQWKKNEIIDPEAVNKFL